MQAREAAVAASNAGKASSSIPTPALSRAAMIYNDAVSTPAVEYAIAAKTYCTQAALEITDTALQLFGGKGLSKGYLIEKLFRDARASLIEDGANDVLMLVGAAQLIKKQGEVVVA